MNVRTGRSVVSLLRHRSRAALKTGVRRATRRLGYDLVPVGHGMSAARETSLRNCGTVLDVGANVGQFAERLRDEGYDRTIVSFEPGSEAFSILQRKSMSADRWQARRVALGSEAGTATLHVSENSVSSSLLMVGARHLAAAPKSVTVDTERVPVSTLDNETRNIEGPFFLKIDVQGYELPVLEGGQSTLERTYAIQVEVSFAELYGGEASWTTLVDWLADRGFLVRYLEPGYEDPQTGHMLQCDVLLGRNDAVGTRACDAFLARGDQ